MGELKFTDSDGDEFLIKLLSGSVSLGPGDPNLRIIHVGRVVKQLVYIDKEQARKLIDYLYRFVES